MGFRLFGVNVEIQSGFWFVTLLWGVLSFYQQPVLVVVWALVVLFSILVHELGHALVVRAHGIEPEIALHGLGGTTTWRSARRLPRRSQIAISLAGPFAGFLVYGLLFAAVMLAPEVVLGLPYPVVRGLEFLEFVNLYWGLINLIPVLPLDGGHVLEAALGPRREALAYRIAVGFGIAAIAFFLLSGHVYAALLLVFCTGHTFQRLSALGPLMPARPERRPVPEEEIDAESRAALLRARAALAAEDLDRAEEQARGVLARDVPPRAALRALEVVGWAQIGRGEGEKALATLRSLERIGPGDPALAGTILYRTGDLRRARRILEGARADGDDRKEVVGPLIRVLLDQREPDRAAAVAFDVIDSLSDEDVRRIAELAGEGGAHGWVARLARALFERGGRPDDAYVAARACALGGEHDLALELLQDAVAAGFTDARRAWEELSPLRDDPRFQAVLPRP